MSSQSDDNWYRYESLDYDDNQIEGLMHYFGFSNYVDLVIFLKNLHNPNASDNSCISIALD